MFKKYQTDIKDIDKVLSKDAKVIIDSDTIAYSAAAVIDERFIKVTHKPSGKVSEFKSVTEFKGRTKDVSDNSYLGSLNIKRKAEGKSAFLIEDFEIEQCSRQALPLSIGEKSILDHINKIKEHFGGREILCLLGSGECFRYKLLLPEQYKSNRTGPRPSKLEHLRNYLMSEFTHKLFKDFKYEADDFISIYGFKGYLDYLKTGQFSYAVASFDKDSRQTPSLLLDYTCENKAFSYPNPWIIPATNKCVGEIDLIKGKAKAIGFKSYIYQLLSGDESDHYNPRMIKGKTRSDNFGDAVIWEELNSRNTPKDLLQFVVDKYNEWYPNGVSFTAWNGVEVKESTAWWLEQMHQCVYMKRSMDDNLTFKTLANKFGVSI